MPDNRVQTTHLKRLAVIYVRQSSTYQVEANTESRRRQYQLTERAQLLGWPAAQCATIDDDLGISGAQSYNRPGYQRLISMIALREVGLILGLEVSRLARNSLDWYQLLELAAAFDVLIADEDGVYDPHEFNDRLLLGLKGTISEVELYQIRSRMVRGRLNKVRRGEFIFKLPIGMEHDPLTKELRPSVDQSVRHAIERVFLLFRQHRSIRAVLKHLRLGRATLPFRHAHRVGGVVIEWREPSYEAIYGIISNPIYAGVYCYGKRVRERNPLTQSVHHRKLPRAEWEVFLPDHHPGYLGLEEYEENLRIMANNRSAYTSGQGAPRTGPTLLQGLVYCKHCGNKMRAAYTCGRPYYQCDRARRLYAGATCNSASAVRVDALVSELLLGVINQETVRQSLAFDQQLGEEARLVERALREQVQRLEYEVDLARRRYELVDPANRLVAQTLETAWNARLLALEAGRQEYEARRPSPQTIASTLEEIEQAVTDLRRLWHSGTITDQDKKEILRCLIERVFLERKDKVIRVEVSWYGGAMSELDVPMYLFSTPQVYHRVVELARQHTDAEIAEALNEEGVQTAKGKRWNVRRVMDFRLTNAIASGFTRDPDLRITENGYITSAEAAARLGVSQSAVQMWYKHGLLQGKHDGGQSALWILWDADNARRLDGTAPPASAMVSVRRLCREQGKKREEVLTWAVRQGYEIYRLRRGSKQHFYILPQ